MASSMVTGAIFSPIQNPKGVSFKSLVNHTCISECVTSIKIPHTKQDFFTGLLFTNGRHFSHFLQPVYAVDSELDTSVPDLKDIDATLKKAKVVVESREGDKIQVRVDLTGKETRKVFDDVLTNFARTAPAIPGFRRQKGGKTSNVPKEYLIKAIGEARIVKFVIQEIVSTSMTVYVEEENLKVKKQFKTIQSAEELESQFEPGKDFGFNATMEVDTSETTS